MREIKLAFVISSGVNKNPVKAVQRERADTNDHYENTISANVGWWRN